MPEVAKKASEYKTGAIMTSDSVRITRIWVAGIVLSISVIAISITINSIYGPPNPILTPEQLHAKTLFECSEIYERRTSLFCMKLMEKHTKE